MRTEILIALAVGALFFFPSAIMAALAIKYATSSRLWDVILLVGIAGMICSVATLALFINSQNKELPILWPALLTNLGICLLVAGIGWQVSGIVVPGKASPDAATSSAHPLKRLIVYRVFDPIVPWVGTESKFHGYNITVQNIGDDTITARLMFLNADMDGIKVLAITDPGAPAIIQQTAVIKFQTWMDDPDISIPQLDAKAITVEFEIDYDTIPESGIRRSYRKITYNLNWANGKNSAPLLEFKIVNEWER